MLYFKLLYGHAENCNTDVLGRGKHIFKDSVRLIARFVRVLGRGKHIFKDSVRLIARFYSRSEYDKSLER